MLKRLLSTASRRQAVVFAALSLLVLLTPFGSEATNPIMLGIYRTLLFVIAGAAAIGANQERKARISPYFLCGVGGVLAGMMFFFYRKDVKSYTELWKTQTSMLVEVVKENTRSNVQLTGVVDALHKRLDRNGMHE